VAVTHQRLCDVEPIRLAIDAHHSATVAIGLDHIDENIAVADEVDQRSARGVTVRLIFFRRIDVLQSHVDIAPLGRADQKTIAIEDLANRAREVTVIRVCRGGCPEQAHSNQ
jgi:hypothetical protein